LNKNGEKARKRTVVHDTDAIASPDVGQYFKIISASNDATELGPNATSKSFNQPCCSDSFEKRYLVSKRKATGSSVVGGGSAD